MNININSLLISSFLILIGINSNAQDWNQLGLDIEGELAGDYAGYAVSLSADGMTVAIGAPRNDGFWGITDDGQVRVLDWNGSSWVQRGNGIKGQSSGDWTGTAVSLSADGNRVAVAEPNHDGNGNNAGRVRVFAWDAGVNSWVQFGAVIVGEAAQDKFGSSISLSGDGNKLVVGAPANDENGSDAGHARLYIWGGFNWLLQREFDGEAASDRFGSSVKLSRDGMTVAIGAPYHDGNGVNSGTVRVYTYTGYVWQDKGWDLHGEAFGDQSGTSLSLSADGNTMAIGAHYHDGNGTNAGHVRVLDWNGFTWIQRGNDVDGQNINDQSGRAVALSDDGNTLAVGERFNDSNGVNAGRIRLYDWSGGAWVQKGSDVTGTVADDKFAWALDLSADGNVVAGGSLLNDAAGMDAGHVKIYSFSCGIDLTVYREALNTIYVNPVAGATYQWLTCTDIGYTTIVGATANSYSSVAGGSFAVVVTENGCADTSACITIYPRLIMKGRARSSDANELDTENRDLQVYPNPTSGLVNIRFSELKKDITVFVRNINGQVIDQLFFAETELINYNITAPTGLYLLEIYDAKAKLKTLKLIKE